MNRTLGWAVSVTVHGLLLLLVLWGHFLPENRPAEKVVVMDLSQFVPEVAPPPPPPPSPEERVPTTSEPDPVPLPAPIPAASQTQSAGPEAGTGPVSAEPDYLPQYKIDKLPALPTGTILGKIVYPPLAAKQGIEATVILELFIDQTGRVRRVTVLKDPGFGFAEAAEAALEGILVVPAESGGQPVAVRYRYPVRFTLK